MTRRNELAAERSLTVPVSIITDTPCGESLSSVSPPPPPPPPSEKKRARYPTRVSDDLDDRLLLPTPSKLHTVNHTATNNYPRATFPFLLAIHVIHIPRRWTHYLTLNLPLRTINYPSVIRQKVTGNCDIRIYRPSYLSFVSLFLFLRFLNDILIKILRSRRNRCNRLACNRSKCDVM